MECKGMKTRKVRQQCKHKGRGDEEKEEGFKTRSEEKKTKRTAITNPKPEQKKK